MNDALVFDSDESLLHCHLRPMLHNVKVRVSFAGCAVLILGGWVKAELAVGCVDWELLLLIGSSLGLSKAIPNSGLASLAGDAMKASGMSHWASLCFLFGFSTVREWT